MRVNAAQRWWTGLSALVLLVGVGITSPLGAGTKPASAKTPASSASQEKAKAEPAKTYLGSSACLVCHEDIAQAFEKNNKHAAITKRREDRACESCHGPGSVHAESAAAPDIRNPAKLPVREADKGCLGCHMGSATHVGRVQGSHARNQVGCTSCHPVHEVHDASKARGAVAVNALCATCHAPVWASFQRPQKHRLPEGAMSCVDCHNPHGGLKPGNQRLTGGNEPGCFSCHGDKRGPFTFEHSPVRTEGCATCHEPHGSANPRMLTRAEVRFQCLECHSNVVTPNPATSVVGGVPPAFHDLRSPRYRNCTICHIKIHGSHVSKVLTR